MVRALLFAAAASLGAAQMSGFKEAKDKEAQGTVFPLAGPFGT